MPKKLSVVPQDSKMCGNVRADSVGAQIFQHCAGTAGAETQNTHTHTH